MHIRLLALPLALLGVVGSTQAATHTLSISGNVLTGQLWHAATDAGNGASRSCSLTAGVVDYYVASFFTDETADTYRLQVHFPSMQSGFVYLYRDAFHPEDPCNGIVAFALAPDVNIPNIHLDANHQYCFVTSEAVLYGGEGSFQMTFDGPQSCHLFLGNSPGTPGSFCFGDGFDPNVSISCPCGNSGAAGHGCNNSSRSGGGLMTASGTLEPDALVLHVSGVPSNALSIFLQGNAIVASGLPFGDGIRCTGGALKRIGVKVAARGSASYPEAGDISIREMSEREADAIPTGGIRYYQMYYRDPQATFCPLPPGNSWNVSNGLRVTWP